MTYLHVIPDHIVNRYSGHTSIYSRHGMCDVVTVYLKYWFFTRKVEFKFTRSGTLIDDTNKIWNYVMSNDCIQFLEALSGIDEDEEDTKPPSGKPVDRKHMKVIK